MARSPMAWVATCQPARCASMIVSGQLVGVHLEVAAVAGLALEVADIAAVRPTSEPSVKIFIAPSRSQSSPKPVRRPRSMPASMPSAGARPGGGGRRCDHQLDPDAQPALVAGGDVGGQLDRGLTDPAAADAGLVTLVMPSRR